MINYVSAFYLLKLEVSRKKIIADGVSRIKKEFLDQNHDQFMNCHCELDGKHFLKHGK